MARYHCRACSFDGEAAWTGELVCPSCRCTTGVGVAMTLHELATFDPVVDTASGGRPASLKIHGSKEALSGSGASMTNPIQAAKRFLHRILEGRNARKYLPVRDGSG